MCKVSLQLMLILHRDPAKLPACEPGTGTESTAAHDSALGLATRACPGRHTPCTATLQVQTPHVGFHPCVTEEKGATRRPCQVTELQPGLKAQLTRHPALFWGKAKMPVHSGLALNRSPETA